jgi:hypothetical protein
MPGAGGNGGKKRAVVPVASGFRRADLRGSRGLRLSDQHPRMPLWSPGRQHREELPRHLCSQLLASVAKRSDAEAIARAKAGLFAITGCEKPRIWYAARKRSDVRVLIYEACRIVDLVMYNHVQVLLGVVLRDIGVGEFLVGHCGDV